MKELDKDRARDLLRNWRRFSRDNPPDPAEVYYYTISPDFRDYVKPNPGPAPYDLEAALMVEEVFSWMFKRYPFERDMLVSYYQRSGAIEEVAQMLGYSRRQFGRLLDASHQVFSRAWYEFIDSV